jgi:FKBP-type peptidyl-prolyl cis-trans isomerase
MKRKLIMLFVVTGLVAAIIVTGCNPVKKYEKQEQDLINHYILTLGDTVYSLKPSGLYYIEIEEGTGRMPIDKDTVSIRFTIKPLNGELLDSNMDADEPFVFVVGNVGVLLGLNEGVHYMKNGGKARLVIPSWLGYGTEGWYPYISGYTPLLMTLELVDVREGPVE